MGRKIWIAEIHGREPEVRFSDPCEEFLFLDDGTAWRWVECVLFAVGAFD